VPMSSGVNDQVVNDEEAPPPVSPKAASAPAVAPTSSAPADETAKVSELLATIQRKENEIALLQNKLLKRQYRIRALKKRLGEEEFDQ